MIQAGTASQTQAMPVVRLSQNSLLRLILPVPESAVPTVHVGQQVEVRVPTLNRTFPGRVARFSEKVQLATRTMDTEVDVPNPSLLLIPGMYAEVDLTLERRDGVLAVPVTAVDTDGDGQAAQSKVMVVTPNNRLEVRKVDAGPGDVEQRRSALRPERRRPGGASASRASLQAGQEVNPEGHQRWLR